MGVAGGVVGFLVGGAGGVAGSLLGRAAPGLAESEHTGLSTEATDSDS